jgi:hypothetical protein
MDIVLYSYTYAMKKILVIIFGLLIAIAGYKSIAYYYSPADVQTNFKLLNNYRSSLWLNQLTRSQELADCWEKFLKRQVDNNHVGHFVVQSPGINMWATPMDRCGYVTYGGLGENLISNVGYAAWWTKAFELWKSSEWHDYNMKYATWKYVWIAFVASDDKKTWKWIQLFSDGPLTKDGVPPTTYTNSTAQYAQSGTLMYALTHNNSTWNASQTNKNVPLSDMLRREPGKISYVNDWGKKLIRLQITLDYEYDSKAKTSSVLRDILTTLKKLFDPL